MNIVNVGYDSTNYYLIDSKGGKILVDCGWPGTLPKLRAELRRKGIAFEEIKYLLVTHFHPDHAGLTQELRNSGLRLLVWDCQLDGIPLLTEFFRGKSYPYVEITPGPAPPLKLKDSRDILAAIGIHGEVLHTPGHSDDSVTLILDGGYAFTGDLPPRFMVPEEDKITHASWNKIHAHSITTVLPAHGGWT